MWRNLLRTFRFAKEPDQRFAMCDVGLVYIQRFFQQFNRVVQFANVHQRLDGMINARSWLEVGFFSGLDDQRSRVTFPTV